MVPVKPHRPLGRPALARLVSTRNITLTILRNEGLATLLVINKYFGELYDEETRAEAEGREPDLPEFPVEEMRRAVRRGAVNAATDWAVQATRAGLDYLAHVKLHPDLSERLLKDLRSSAIRKTRRMPWHVRAARVTRTALFSESTLFAADVVVSSAMEALRAIRGVGPYSPVAFALHDPAHPALAATLAPSGASPLVPVATVHASIGERLLRWLSRATLHLARGCVALCAVALANGIAWSMPAARGTLAFAGAQGASVLANLVMARVMERVLTRQVLACQRKRAGKGPNGDADASFAGAVPPSAPRRDDQADASQSADLPAATDASPNSPEPASAPAQTGRPTPLVPPEPFGDLSGAEVPPVPTPQQRRLAGPRLPERPPRRAAPQRAAAVPVASAPAPATPPSREDRPTLPGAEAGRPWDGTEPAAAVAARVAERAVANALSHAQRVTATGGLPAPLARDPADEEPVDEAIAPTSLAAAFVTGADVASSP